MRVKCRTLQQLVIHDILLLHWVSSISTLLTLRNTPYLLCTGLADANSSGHDAFVTGYEALVASVLSIPASQAELQSLQTGTAPASAPVRRRLLTSKVHAFSAFLVMRLFLPASPSALLMLPDCLPASLSALPVLLDCMPASPSAFLVSFDFMPASPNALLVLHERCAVCCVLHDSVDLHNLQLCTMICQQEPACIFCVILPMVWGYESQLDTVLKPMHTAVLQARQF